MRRFVRRPEPDFWGFYERRWLYETKGPSVDPLRWDREKRTLANWFHAEVRPNGEPERCAYCDGPLGVESPETIDHFIPAHACRAFVLTWENLYPACVVCNSTFKGRRGSCALVRPDVDPVEDWFDFDEMTGKLAPAPGLDRRTRARVRLTIHVFGLNEAERCAARRTFLRTLRNALSCGELGSLTDAVSKGLYRFVARKFMASARTRELIRRSI